MAVQCGPAGFNGCLRHILRSEGRAIRQQLDQLGRGLHAPCETACVLDVQCRAAHRPPRVCSAVHRGCADRQCCLASSAILSCASSVLPPMCGVKIVLGMPVGQCKTCDHCGLGAEPGARPPQMCVADEHGKGGRNESCTYARAATAGRLLMQANGAGRDNAPQEDSDKAECQSPASGV